MPVFLQHCIEGKMTFAPIFYGLDCGAYPEKPKGSWHDHGYQMIGMFKKDWELIGGELENKKKVVLFGIFSIFYLFVKSDRKVQDCLSLFSSNRCLGDFYLPASSV